MALKKETLQAIATKLKIKEAELEAAIKDEKEVDLAIPEDLEVLTKAELEQRDTNQKNEGIKVGKEIGVKEVRTAAGLEETVGKDPKKVADAIVEKAVKEAKVEPDKQVTQLKEQVGLLQTQLTAKETEIGTFKQKATEAALDAKILTAFPKNRVSTLNDSEFLTLIKSSISIEEVDGKLQVKKGGEILRDPKTTNPLGLEEAITNVFTERKWIDATPGGGTGGRGGKDEPGGGTGVFTKMSEFKKHYEDQGKSITGQEAQEHLAQIMKDNKDFDANS